MGQICPESQAAPGLRHSVPLDGVHPALAQGASNLPPASGTAQLRDAQGLANARASQTTDLTACIQMEPLPPAHRSALVLLVWSLFIDSGSRQFLNKAGFSTCWLAAAVGSYYHLPVAHLLVLFCNLRGLSRQCLQPPHSQY